MKNIFFFVLIIILVGCTNSSKFNISGVIDGAEGKTITLKRLDLNEEVIIGNDVIGSNGRFSFSNERLKEPTFFLLELDNQVITLLADTTEQIEVNASKDTFVSDYTVANSMGSSLVRILNQKLIKVEDVTDSLINSYQSTKDLNLRKEIEQKWEEVIQEQKQFVGDFVMEHPQSFSSYYAIFQKINNEYLLDISYAKDQVYFATIATSLNILYPESARVKQLYKMVLREKQKAANARFANVAKSINPVGFPEIVEKDINGNEIALSSLKEKVILLSFWASFDGPSRKLNKQLKNLYNKYKSRGFEIYQVSLDKSKVLWEKAIIEDELPWINVSDLRYIESVPAITYNVQDLPTLYLISKKGEIVGKNIYGALLDEKINKYLN